MFVAADEYKGKGTVEKRRNIKPIKVRNAVHYGRISFEAVDE
jgi:hypothetical protein